MSERFDMITITRIYNARKSARKNPPRQTEQNPNSKSIYPESAVTNLESSIM